MFNYYRRANSNIFVNRTLDVSSFTSDICLEVRLSGSKKPTSLIIFNDVNSTTTVINHSLKTIVYSGNVFISVCKINDNNFIVIINNACFMGSLLINITDNKSELGCSGYLIEHRVSFGSIKNNGYKEFYAKPLGINDVDVIHHIQKAIKKHISLLSNSFKLFCDDDDIEYFYKYIKEIGVIDVKF